MLRSVRSVGPPGRRTNIRPNRHLKKTASVRAEYKGVKYTQARREILDSLACISEFGHLPIMWDCANDDRSAPLPPEMNYRAALGAVQLAMRDLNTLAGARSCDHWRTIDGHVGLDWDRGPYLHEVVRELLADAEDPFTPGLRPGELLPGLSRLGDLNAVWIYGVRVRFRPYNPIGSEASHRLAWAELDEGLRAQNEGP